MTMQPTSQASHEPDCPPARCLRPDPARIVVPRKHGEILVEPPMRVLAAALGNMSVPCKDRTLLGIPFSEIRKRARADLLTAIQRHAAAINAPAPGAAAADRPWVITGHQVEFYHAGVWAKVLVADALARNARAVAIDLLVDHDVFDHLGFDMPQQLPDGTWIRKPVHWAEAEGHASAHAAADGLDMPSPAQFDAWDAKLAKHPAAHTDALAFVLSALKPPADRADLSLGDDVRSYTPWMSRARTSVEAALGIDVHHVATSGLCDSLAWPLFVLAWLGNADAWTAAYNTQLAAYRKANGIHNDHHPMPDLHRDGAFELPFWIYRVGEPRNRLIVRRDANGTFEIHHGFDVIPIPRTGAGPAAWTAARQLDETLAARHLVVRPRALTLTMFVRLFVSDLFIHGIGGALYDQITNGILETLFGQAPSYACASAAWLLPLGQPLEADSDISAILHQRHHLQHNPQLAIDPFTALKTDFAELIAQRRGLIQQIQASLDADRKTGREARQTLFRELQAVNARLHQKHPRALGKLNDQLAAARLAADQNKVLLWREYYFGLHTMDSLRGLIHAVRGQQ